MGQFCVKCHGADEAEEGLRLDLLLADIAHHATDNSETRQEDYEEEYSASQRHEILLSMFELIEAEEMPPAKTPQPEQTQTEEMLHWLEARISEYDCSENIHPGKVTIHRLNRVEYRNTIRDLLGIDYEATDDFPADDVGHGFDNNADVLSLPPLLFEKYMVAAEEIVEQALADDQLRKRLISHEPSDDLPIKEAAELTIQNFATRAFRRPVRESELERFMELAAVAVREGLDYRETAGFLCTAILTHPSFLFRIELDGKREGDEESNQNRRLNDYELASRLSYFLWSSMPDDELFRLAAEEKLGDREVLEAQVTRMLNDPKSNALIENFTGQWLQLRFLTTLAPDPEMFPQFNEELRTSMLHETEMFFESIVREDRDITEFLDADFSFVNESLAELYGIEGVKGPEMRRVSLAGSVRGGLLTQASILTLTSNPNRTSPVKRGVWILENILGTPPPPPPPGVEELQEGEAELLGTLRQRLEQHRTDPSCAVCHETMDALGLGFENFDAIGAWRDVDGRDQIDASGTLPGQQEFQGPSELKKILKIQRNDQFIRCLAEKMLVYALGRGLESFDRCAIDEVVTQVEEDENRFSKLVLAVVMSHPFQMRGSTGE